MRLLRIVISIILIADMFLNIKAVINKKHISSREMTIQLLSYFLTITSVYLFWN